MIYIPDGYIQDLEQLQADFDEWVYRQPECWVEWQYGGEVCAFNEDEFLRYVNEIVLKDSSEKACFIEVSKENQKCKNILYF